MDIHENDIEKNENLPEDAYSEESTGTTDTVDAAEKASATTGYSDNCNSTCGVDVKSLEQEYAQLGDTGVKMQQPAASGSNKKLVQRTIIISAIAVAAVMIIVGGVFLVYNLFFKLDIKGTWVQEGTESKGVYLVIESDGKIMYDLGGMRQTGSYTLSTDSDGKNLLTSDFLGGEYTYDIVKDNGTKTLIFHYAADGQEADYRFNAAERPAYSIDPTVITNASADEVGLTTLQTDDKIIGSWSEEQYGTYTFNADGTGSNSVNGANFGAPYSIELDFKYTVKDNVIYITLESFAGEKSDDAVSYALDGDSLVLNGTGYKKADK